MLLAQLAPIWQFDFAESRLQRDNVRTDRLHRHLASETRAHLRVPVRIAGLETIHARTS
jgi:hypothetical protein